jgi:hypothetical protein
MGGTYSTPSTCTSCGDSALSQAASIVGILMFAYATLFSILFSKKYFYTAARSAPRELEKKLSALRTCDEALNQWEPYLESSESVKALVGSTGISLNALDLELLSRAHQSGRELAAILSTSCGIERSGRWQMFQMRAIMVVYQPKWEEKWTEHEKLMEVKHLQQRHFLQ